MMGVGAWQVVRGVQSCNGTHQLTWSEHRATSLEVGDFTIKIPDGWRDAAEATDQKMKNLLAAQPGARVLVREKFDGETVMFKAAANEPVTAAPPCDQLAATLAKSESSTASNISPQTFDGDFGCRWTARRNQVEVHYNVRFHGPQVFVVACSRNAPCDQMLAAVTAK